MIQEGILALVSADATLGPLLNGKAYAVTLPEGVVYPAMAFSIVGGSSQPTFNTPGAQKMRLQFDFFDLKYRGAAVARDVFRTLIEGYHGVLTNGPLLQDAQWVQDLDFFDSDARVFRCVSEFYFFFS